MSLARVKTWLAGDLLTALDLNNEFNNVLNNPISLISPTTGVITFSTSQTVTAAMVTTGTIASGASLFFSTAATPLIDTFAIGTSGQVLTVSTALKPSWAAPSASAVIGFGDGTAAITAGQTTYYGSWAGTAGGADAIAFDHIMPFAGTVRNFYFRATTVPGGAETRTGTLQLETADQTVTAIMTSTATTANDTTHSFTFVAGARISVKIVASGGAASGSIRGSFEVFRTP